MTSSQEIYAVKQGNVYKIMGKTFPFRSMFQTAGAKWDANEKVWYFLNEIHPTIKALVSEIREDVNHPLSQVERMFNPPQHIETKTIRTVKAREGALKRITKKPRPKATDTWFVKPSWWQLAMLYIQHRPALAVVGPAGNGKTTTVEQALRALSIPFLSISCTDRTEVLDLVGGTVLTAQGEMWRDGLVTTAFKQGMAVVMDEADTLDPRVMMSLQNALQDGGVDGKARYVNTPDGRVYPSGKCPIVLCMNTTGAGATRAYNGRNKLDGASLDRLSYIATGYENEASIITSRGHKQETADKIVEWASITRSKIDNAGINVTLSPRTLLRMAQGMDLFGWNLPTSAEREFLSRLSPDQVEVIASKQASQPSAPTSSFSRFGSRSNG